MIPFYVFLFCLFATYGVYLILTRRTAEQRAQMTQRLAEALSDSGWSNNSDVRLARDELMSEIPLMHRWLMQLQLATRLKRMIEQADLQLTVMRLFMFSAIAGLLATLAVAKVTVFVSIAIGAGLLAATIPFLHLLYKRKQRFTAFLENLPEALDLMARSLAAGHAFSETLSIVADEMPEPISMEFRRTYEENRLGLPFKVALENLAERVPLMDLKLCMTAIAIQRETGGNLSEILEKVAQTIRERFKIMEDLKTLTTQSRISAWVLCAVPIFIAVAASIINPEYMSVLWEDARGQKLMALALGMQLTGMLIVRKILNIKI
ncbi:MAG: type II secretion system F family protein [Blastocatellales bacterium]